MFGPTSAAIELLRLGYKEMCENGWRIDCVPLLDDRPTKVEQHALVDEKRRQRRRAWVFR